VFFTTPREPIQDSLVSCGSRCPFFVRSQGNHCRFNVARPYSTPLCRRRPPSLRLFNRNLSSPALPRYLPPGVLTESDRPLRYLPLCCVTQKMGVPYTSDPHYSGFSPISRFLVGSFLSRFSTALSCENSPAFGVRLVLLQTFPQTSLTISVPVVKALAFIPFFIGISDLSFLDLLPSFFFFLESSLRNQITQLPLLCPPLTPPSFTDSIMAGPFSGPPEGSQPHKTCFSVRA